MYGQMIISGFRGLSLSDDNPVIRDVKEFDLGGVILYDEEVADPNMETRNIESPAQTGHLVKSLKNISPTPMLIGVDQEGGEIQRLKAEYGFPDCPSWGEVGKQNDLSFTHEFSKAIARTLCKNGFNVNFAPVLDLDISRQAFVPRENRCLSADPEKVAEHAQIFIKEHLDRNIIPILKHFPGLGSATTDTHADFTDISNSWSDSELEPYRILFSSLDIPLVLVGHCFHKGLDPDWPASMSPNIITGLLRSELGFEGVVICDDPMMGAISNHYPFDTVIEQMIIAGVDLFCFGNNLIYDPDIVPKTIDTISELKKMGRISSRRMDESLERISKLKTSFA